MSLNFNLSAIKDSEKMCFETHIGTAEEMQSMVAQRTLVGCDWRWSDESQREVIRMHPVTYVLVMCTMSVGMGEITRKNWKEFYTRIYIAEQVWSQLLTDSNGTPRLITPDEILSHIGLRTNVSEETRAAFHGRVMRSLREEAVRKINASKGAW